MREASVRGTVTGTDSYAFLISTIKRQRGDDCGIKALMQTKLLTPKICKVLSKKVPVEIPVHLLRKANTIGVKDIYVFNNDLSEIGVYGNVVVVLGNSEFVDLQICPETVDAILEVLK